MSLIPKTTLAVILSLGVPPLALAQEATDPETPLVQQHTVDLPPVVTIFAIIAFGVLFGSLGVLLATPLAVVCMVLVKKLWVREVLEEDVELPGEAEAEAQARD